MSSTIKSMAIETRRCWSSLASSPATLIILLFGINGVLAELLIGGPALVMAPFWIFVYGLMIFLPAYSFPSDERTPAPRWYHYLGAIAACLLASAVVALVVNLLAPLLPHFGATLSFSKP